MMSTEEFREEIFEVKRIFEEKFGQSQVNINFEDKDFFKKYELHESDDLAELEALAELHDNKELIDKVKLIRGTHESIYPIAVHDSNNIYIADKEVNEIREKLSRDKKSCPAIYIGIHELLHNKYSIGGEPANEFLINTMMNDFIRDNFSDCYPIDKDIMKKLVIKEEYL